MVFLTEKKTSTFFFVTSSIFLIIYAFYKCKDYDNLRLFRQCRNLRKKPVSSKTRSFDVSVFKSTVNEGASPKGASGSIVFNVDSPPDKGLQRTGVKTILSCKLIV